MPVCWGMAAAARRLAPVNVAGILLPVVVRMRWLSLSLQKRGARTHPCVPSTQQEG